MAIQLLKGTDGQGTQPDLETEAQMNRRITWSLLAAETIHSVYLDTQATY